MDVGGNMVIKDEEKTEVLNAFFASNRKTSFLQVPNVLSWKIGMRRRMNPP